jgi:uncharacterized membrane protein YcgQ (UPF0703/DUF1980 family)
MIIYNVKLNKKLILKFVLVVMAIICISLTCVLFYNIFTSSTSKNQMNLIDDSIPSSEPAIISSTNYTNVLKQVHNNLDTYVGQKIIVTGYVYKIDSFNNNEFVIARDMDIGDNKTLVVGFLCNYKETLEANSWITVTGSIEKGTFNNEEIPVLKITNVEKANVPVDVTVPMPDDEYVPTAVIY